MDEKITCDVLTGFLGSGKTTLLNAFLHQHGTGGVAVIVNEFGSIGLDQFVFQEVAENVYLLDSGCLCCTVTHSLRETLLQLKSTAEQPGHERLRHVIIETTGLANPLPVLHSLLGDRVLMDYFRLGRVITTVDAVQGAAQLDRYAESLRQASVADELIITKTDMVDAAAIRHLWQRLAQVNPHAQISSSAPGQDVMAVFGGQQGVDAAVQTLQQAYIGRQLPAPESLPPQAEATHTHSHDEHDNGVGSWSTFIDTQPTWAGVSAWWNLVVHQYGDNLLRCKGLFHMDDARHPFVLIQGVGKVFHTPSYLARWPDTDPRSRVVCIGSGLDANWLQESLRALEIVEPAGHPLTLAEISDCLP